MKHQEYAAGQSLTLTLRGTKFETLKDLRLKASVLGVNVL